MEISVRNYWIFLSLLLCLSLGIRLVALFDLAPQVDERHWVSRSAKVINMFELKPWKATSHLGHPGVPPAIIMGLGQSLGIYWNRLRDDKGGRSLSRLDSSRLVVAILSAFLAPLIFIGILRFVGFWPAALSSFLIAFDPLIVGYSRMAHLDALLSLFVACSVLLYIHAIEKNNIGLKMLSGIAWGLCIATKPTAGILVLCFLLYRILRFFFADLKNKHGETSLLAWSDIWAVIIGHAVFALIFTRFWIHRSDYFGRLHIRIRLAGILFNVGKYLQKNTWIFVAIAAILALVLAWLAFSHYKKSKKWKYHLSMCLALLLFFTCVLFTVPQVLENIVRFWKWAFSLSAEEHVSFDHVMEPLPYGYLQLFLYRFSPLWILAFFAALGFLVKDLFSKADEKLGFIIFMLIVFLLWVLPLNASNKQTLRYVLPVLPAMYILVVFAFFRIWQCFASKWRLKKSLTGTFFVCLLLYQLLSTLSLSPHYYMYFSPFNGGPQAFVKRGIPLPLLGQKEATNFLINESDKTKERSYIAVSGDSATLAYSASHFFPKKAGRLHFGYYPPTESDYLIRQGSILRFDEKKWGSIFAQEPVFVFEKFGVEFISIYEVPRTELKAPIVLAAVNSDRNVGKKVYKDKEQKKIIVGAMPERDAAGYLLFYRGYRLVPGNYQISFYLKLDRSLGDNIVLNNDKKVLRLDFGETCSRVLTLDEMSADQEVFELNCELSSDERISPRIYWFGTYPVLVEKVIVRSKQNL